MENNGFNGEHLVVGEEGKEGVDCLAIDLAKDTHTCPLIRGNKTTLARTLTDGAKGFDLTSLEQKLLLGIIEFPAYLTTVYEAFGRAKGGKATLDKILLVIEDELGSISAGETIRLYYNLPCKGCENPNLQWIDIPLAFRRKINETMVKYQHPPIDERASETHLSYENLIKLMRGEEPHFHSPYNTTYVSMQP